MRRKSWCSHGSLALKSLGLSYGKIAEAVGTSAPYIANLIAGRCAPGTAVRDRLHELYEIAPAWWLEPAEGPFTRLAATAGNVCTPDARATIERHVDELRAHIEALWRELAVARAAMTRREVAKVTAALAEAIASLARAELDVAVRQERRTK